MDQTTFQEQIKTGLDKMQITDDQNKLEYLWVYMQFLISENEKYNLTAIDQPREIISKHFLDSLALLTDIKLKKGDKVIDVGTGAGFPGLVLKIFFPEIKLVLLDSLAKRIHFLSELIYRLKLKGIETIHARAEDLAREENYRENFDWVVSRAVAPLNILVEYTLPFARLGGVAALYKGPDYQGELVEAERAINLLGGELTPVSRVKVAELKAERYLIVINKHSNTPAKYPRRAGIPKKRPL